MKEKLKKLLAAYQAKRARIAELKEKADPTDEEFNEYKTLIETASKEAEEIESLGKSIKGADEIDSKLKEWENTAVLPVPFSNGREAQRAEDDTHRDAEHVYANGARLLGTQYAGRTFVDIRQKDMDIFSEGEALFDKKKMEALNSKDYKRGFIGMIKGKGETRHLPGDQVKALQEGVDDQGGFWVPPDWTADMMIDREPTPSSVSPYVTQLDTASDRKVFPKNVYTGATDDPNASLYTSGVRVTYPGEVPGASTDIDATQPTPGLLEINIYTAMLALSMTLNQLEDSAFSIMQWITNKFQETVRLEYDRRILTGSGVNQARGILASPSANANDANNPQYIASGDAATFTGNAIKKLIHALAPQYLPNSRFVMNWQNTAQVIDTLKDSEGRYLWSMGQQDNNLSANILSRPLQGFGVSYNEFMPSPAAGTFPVIFGSLKSYYLVRRVGFSIQVLRETKAKLNQVELIGRLRFGGDVAEPWALKILQCHT